MGVSALHAKNNVHDALHFTEALRVQVISHFNVLVVGLAISKARRVGVNSMSRRRKRPVYVS
jgi:hypothetical protein